MRRPSRTGLLWVLVICITPPITAQNLEAIGKEKPVSLSGGISINHIYYASRGIAARRDPNNFVVSGNSNIAFYGWNVPLNFTVSNQSSTFTQPFNQYALHPKWKWITVHAGYTSMSFSPYSVNGHIFRGVGIDLEPGERWHLSALYGRFKKTVEADSTTGSTPAFRRPGYAVRVRYGDENDFIEVIAFHARDDQRSVAMPHDSLGILPQQNLVASAGGSKTLARHFVLKGEVAASALTRDTRAERSSDHPLGKVFSFFPATTSTSYYRAFKASLDYQREGWTIGTAYERIDPGYQTLGAYYFNNDLENITVNGTARAFEEKLTVAVSSGFQEDNVDDTKMSTMRRIVSSCNIGYVPSQRMNMSATWSTFQTFTNVRSHFESLNDLTPYDNADTLNFRQVSKNASMSAMYSPGTNPDKKQNLTFNVSWQESADSQGGTPANSTSAAFYNINAGYIVSFLPQNMGFSIMFNASLTNGGQVNTRTMGPTASLTRSYLDRKLRTTGSVSWNSTASNHLNISSLINGRLNVAASFSHNHHLTLGAVFVRRHATESDAHSLEFTATAGYQYSFSKKNE